MDSLEHPALASCKEEKIRVPTCVHAVKPIDHGSEKTQSRLGELVSTYDRIIETAVVQLRLLEAIDMESSAPSLSSPKSAANEQTPRRAALSKPNPANAAPPKPNPTYSAPSKPNPAYPAPIETKFSYTWPALLEHRPHIAVKVNSTNIPVTPWLFRRIFGSAIQIKLHRHSSYEGPIPDLVNDNERAFDAGETKLVFMVIFHNIDKTEFVVDPLRQVPIRDEHNLQRYVLRLLGVFSPIDPTEDAFSENYVDLVGRDLLQRQQPNIVKKTLGFLDNEVRARCLLVRPDQPTPGDFSLLAACYEHDLRGYAGIENFRSNLETFFDLRAGGEQWWFKAEP